jgi:cytochrome c peroxidase
VTAIEIPEPTQSDRGRYRTPSLRNVAATAPYMHNGIYGSLEEVIDHYDNPPEGDGDLDVRLWQDALPEFSPEEVGHLVQFLETLSAEPPAGDAWSAPPHAGFQICNDPGFEIGP